MRDKDKILFQIKQQKESKTILTRTIEKNVKNNKIQLFNKHKLISERKFLCLLLFVILLEKYLYLVHFKEKLRYNKRFNVLPRSSIF